MNRTRNTLLAAALCLTFASSAKAADFSVTLSDGPAPIAHTVLPPSNFKRTYLRILNAGAAGSPSGWCTRKLNIVPGPGVAGSFEIAADNTGEEFSAPSYVPQDAVNCAPLPNQSVALTIEAQQ